GVYRPGDRRSCRQRAARAVRLLSRDLYVSSPDWRRVARTAAGPAPPGDGRYGRPARGTGVSGPSAAVAPGGRADAVESAPRGGPSGGVARRTIPASNASQGPGRVF